MHLLGLDIVLALEVLAELFGEEGALGVRDDKEGVFVDAGLEVGVGVEGRGPGCGVPVGDEEADGDFGHGGEWVGR